MIRVFISHASTDADLASKLKIALATRGVDAFDPSQDLKPGDDISASILRSLRRSDLLVFIVPPHPGQGKSALVELGAAKALGKRIVSVLPERIRAANNDVASVFGNSYFFDAVGKDVDALADQVLSDLTAA